MYRGGVVLAWICSCYGVLPKPICNLYDFRLDLAVMCAFVH